VLEETSQLYTFWGKNVCAEPHLSKSKTEQTTPFERLSITVEVAICPSASWVVRTWLSSLAMATTEARHQSGFS